MALDTFARSGLWLLMHHGIFRPDSLALRSDLGSDGAGSDAYKLPLLAAGLAVLADQPLAG